MEKTKSIHPPKKRITHIGNSLDSQCQSTSDLVDSIINSMNNSSVKIIANDSESSNKGESINQPMNKTTQSSSNDSSQALKMADAKFKKLSLARKFPLMEKSQKILQQLKHNRCMPKPRAHLQSIEKLQKTKSVSPIPKTLHSKRKPVKINEKVRETNRTLTKNLDSKTFNVDSDLGHSFDKQQKVAKEKSNTNKSASIENKGQPVNITHDISQINEEKSRDDITHSSDASESEYEKFIEKNKPKPKKKTKKQGNTKPSKTSLRNKNSKMIDKRSSSKLTEQNYSNFGNDSSEDDHISAYEKVKHTKSKNHSMDDKTEKGKGKTSRKYSLRNKTNRLKMRDSFESVTEQNKNNSDFHNDSSCEESDYENRNEKTSKISLRKRNKKAEKLQSSSLESLVECYGSNFHDDSSDDNETFNNNDNMIESEQVNESLSVKDTLTCFDVGDSSKINLEADSQSSFQKEADKRSENYNSEKLSNIETSSAELCSSSNSNCIIHSKAGDIHNKDSCLKTSVIAENVTAVVDISGSNDSKYKNVDFIPYDEFCATEISNVVKQSETVYSDGSDIEIIEIISRKKEIPACSSSADNTLTSTECVQIDENKIKLSLSHASDVVQLNQTSVDVCTFKNTKCKVESSPLDDGRLIDPVCSTEACFSENSVKQEVAEKHDPVYMTNICHDFDEDNADVKLSGDLLQTSVGSTSTLLKDHKPDICVPNSFENNDKVVKYNENPKSTVDNDDEIIVIDPNCETLNIKQENQEDDDIFIEYEKKAQPKETVLINPVTNLNSKRKNECSFGHEDIENSIKSEYPFDCKIPKITSNQINVTSIEKELALFKANYSTVNKLPGESSSRHKTCSNFEELLAWYKKEFTVYQEIIKTEENVEAGLRFVEAHQAQKLQNIRSLIDKLVNSDSNFNEIYNKSVKDKEETALHSCVESNSSETPKVDILLKSSLEASSENSHVPLTFIKIENDEKSDLLSLAISPISLATDRSNFKCKSEPNTLETSNISQCALVNEKPELNFLGQKCAACGNDAVAACQRCAKVFFCSNKCGKQFWNNGHKDACGS